MGIEPEAQLAFEDSMTGIKAALSAGSMVIAMPVFKKREMIDAMLDVGVRRIFHEWSELKITNVLQNIRQE